MVNASTDEFIRVLEPGDVINLAEIDGKYDLVAHVDTGLDSDSSEFEGSVLFKLFGTGQDTTVVDKIDDTAPYVLGGDINGDYQGFAFEEGAYNLEVIPFGNADSNSVSINKPFSIFFFVVDSLMPPPPPPVDTSLLSISRVDLVNASTDEFIRVLEPGDVINLAEIDGKYDLVAHVDTGLDSDSSEFEGSVLFKLFGTGQDTTVVDKIDDTAPYVLGGDINGDYQGFPFEEGAYSLEVIPFGASDSNSVSINKPFSIFFFVVDSLMPPPPPPVDTNLLSITHIDLVNASTDEFIRVLEPGDVINLSEIDGKYDLVAHVDTGLDSDSSEFEGSVLFKLFGTGQDTPVVDKIDDTAPCSWTMGIIKVFPLKKVIVWKYSFWGSSKY